MSLIEDITKMNDDKKVLKAGKLIVPKVSAEKLPEISSGGVGKEAIKPYKVKTGKKPDAPKPTEEKIKTFGDTVINIISDIKKEKIKESLISPVSTPMSLGEDDDYVAPDNYYSVFTKNGNKWSHYNDLDSASDAQVEKSDLLNRHGRGKVVVLKVPKKDAHWNHVDVDKFVTTRLAEIKTKKNAIVAPIGEVDYGDISSEKKRQDMVANQAKDVGLEDETIFKASDLNEDDWNWQNSENKYSYSIDKMGNVRILDNKTGKSVYIQGDDSAEVIRTIEKLEKSGDVSKLDYYLSQYETVMESLPLPSENELSSMDDNQFLDAMKKTYNIFDISMDNNKNYSAVMRGNPNVKVISSDRKAFLNDIGNATGTALYGK